VNGENALVTNERDGTWFREGRCTKERIKASAHTGKCFDTFYIRMVANSNRPEEWEEEL